MEQLKQQLMEKAHLSEDQSQKAVGVVTDFLREHATDGTLQNMLGNVPGIGQHADKIPADAGGKAPGFLGGLFKRG